MTSQYDGSSDALPQLAATTPWPTVQPIQYPSRRKTYRMEPPPPYTTAEYAQLDQQNPYSQAHRRYRIFAHGLWWLLPNSSHVEIDEQLQPRVDDDEVFTARFDPLLSYPKMNAFNRPAWIPTFTAFFKTFELQRRCLELACQRERLYLEAQAAQLWTHVVPGAFEATVCQQTTMAQEWFIQTRDLSWNSTPTLLGPVDAASTDDEALQHQLDYLYRLDFAYFMDLAPFPLISNLSTHPLAMTEAHLDLLHSPARHRARETGKPIALWKPVFRAAEGDLGSLHDRSDYWLDRDVPRRAAYLSENYNYFAHDDRITSHDDSGLPFVEWHLVRPKDFVYLPDFGRTTGHPADVRLNLTYWRDNAPAPQPTTSTAATSSTSTTSAAPSGVKAEDEDDVVYRPPCKQESVAHDEDDRRGRSRDRDDDFESHVRRTASLPANAYRIPRPDGLGYYFSMKPLDFLLELGGNNTETTLYDANLTRIQADNTLARLRLVNPRRNKFGFTNSRWTLRLIKIYGNYHCPDCHFRPRACGRKNHPLIAGVVDPADSVNSDGTFDPRFQLPTAQFYYVWNRWRVDMMPPDNWMWLEDHERRRDISEDFSTRTMFPLPEPLLPWVLPKDFEYPRPAECYKPDFKTLPPDWPGNEAFDAWKLTRERLDLREAIAQDFVRRFHCSRLQSLQKADAKIAAGDTSTSGPRGPRPRPPPSTPALAQNDDSSREGEPPQRRRRPSPPRRHRRRSPEPRYRSRRPRGGLRRL